MDVSATRRAAKVVGSARDVDLDHPAENQTNGPKKRINHKGNVQSHRLEGANRVRECDTIR
jgi:hypothetical protein